MKNVEQNSFIYLPPNQDDLDRGLYVTTVGQSSAPPDSPYPPQQHPGGYHFDWEHGRILPCFAFVYISKGSGVLETASSPLQNVECGDLMVIFPGEWHRYRPKPSAGWDEHWVGMGGDLTEHFMDPAVYRLEKPLLRIGPNNSVYEAFSRLHRGLLRETPFTAAMATAEAHRLIICVAEAYQNRGRRGKEAGVSWRKMQRARLRMQESLDEPVRLQELAHELGMSYSSFRHRFKTATGLSPHSYLLDLSIGRAKSLLASTSLTVNEISHSLTFTSPYYFMRLFKKRTGRTPSEYRVYSRGENE